MEKINTDYKQRNWKIDRLVEGDVMKGEWKEEVGVGGGICPFSVLCSDPVALLFV